MAKEEEPPSDGVENHSEIFRSAIQLGKKMWGLDETETTFSHWTDTLERHLRKRRRYQIGSIKTEKT